MKGLTYALLFFIFLLFCVISIKCHYAPDVFLLWLVWTIMFLLVGLYIGFIIKTACDFCANTSTRVKKVFFAVMAVAYVWVFALCYFAESSFPELKYGIIDTNNDFSNFVVIQNSLLEGNSYITSTKTCYRSSKVSFIDCLYFSTISTVTLGYGDFRPIGSGRIIALVQVFLAPFALINILGALFLQKKSCLDRARRCYVHACPRQ